MEKKMFYAILPVIVTGVIKTIIEDFKYHETKAMKGFICSNTYSLLENEETKLWHRSKNQIAQLWYEEVNNVSGE